MGLGSVLRRNYVAVGGALHVADRQRSISCSALTVNEGRRELSTLLGISLIVLIAYCIATALHIHRGRYTPNKTLLYLSIHSNVRYVTSPNAGLFLYMA